MIQLFLLIFLAPVLAHAQGYTPDGLKGVKSFGIQINKLPDQAIKAGITSIELLKIIEKAVVDDRLQVVSRDKADGIIVLTLVMQDLLEIGHLYSVQMSLLREAKVRHFRRDVKTMVTVWHQSNMGVATRMGTRQDIRKEVGALIQQFLDDQLEVNSAK